MCHPMNMATAFLSGTVVGMLFTLAVCMWGFATAEAEVCAEMGAEVCAAAVLP